ncbi:hypothetical protein Cgig2_021947 [Carnegiea gigantea]|uniref:Uncharacterized protein n=1 Tax=Carnegiea gigantea TaxID=171969 RepID=A0A9Q1QNH3_9CARY|nr:hypothetical protein Cgig2_021947 [Carnegiea gigantea]
MMIHGDDGVRVFIILDSNKESYKPTSETKEATCKPIFDDHGTLLEHCMKEKNKAQLIIIAWGGFFEAMHYVEANEEDLNMVVEFEEEVDYSRGKVVSKPKDLESFIGCDLPKEVEIHPLKSSTTKGSRKRIKGGKEEVMEQKQKHPRHCTSCGQYAYHDRRIQRIKIMYPNNW